MTGPDRFEEMWNKATGYHPELVERWGQNIPRDELGQPKREVLQYLLSLPLDTSVQDKPQVKAVGPGKSLGGLFEPVTGVASNIWNVAKTINPIGIGLRSPFADFATRTSQETQLPAWSYPTPGDDRRKPQALPTEASERSFLRKLFYEDDPEVTIEKRRFRPDVPRLVDPEAAIGQVQGPAYFTRENFSNIRDLLGQGLASVYGTGEPGTDPLWGNFASVIKNNASLLGRLVSDRDREALKDIGESAVEPLKFFEGTAELTRPLQGALLALEGTPLYEPELKARADILLERGKAQGRSPFLNWLESHAGAFEQTAEAGQMSPAKQALAEFITDPGEALPGVGLYAGGVKALTGAARTGGRLSRWSAAQASPDLFDANVKDLIGYATRKRIGDIDELPRDTQRAIFGPLRGEGADFQAGIKDWAQKLQQFRENPVEATRAAAKFYLGEVVGGIREDPALRFFGRLVEEPDVEGLLKTFRNDLSLEQIAAQGANAKRLGRPKIKAGTEGFPDTYNNQYRSQLEQIKKLDDPNATVTLPPEVSDMIGTPAKFKKYKDKVEIYAREWDKGYNSTPAPTPEEAAVRVAEDLQPRKVVGVGKDIAVELAQKAPRHTYDPLIKDDVARQRVSNLMQYQIDGKDLQRNFKPAFGRELNNLSIHMFGDKSTANRAKTRQYIEDLVTEGGGAIEDEVARVITNILAKPDDANARFELSVLNKEHFYKDPEDGLLKYITKKPLRNLMRGQKDEASEVLLTDLIEELAGTVGEPAENMIRSGAPLSQWARDLNPALSQGVFYDLTRKSLREFSASMNMRGRVEDFMTPSQLESTRGIKNTVHALFEDKLIPPIRGAVTTAKDVATPFGEVIGLFRQVDDPGLMSRNLGSFGLRPTEVSHVAEPIKKLGEKYEQIPRIGKKITDVGKKITEGVERVPDYMQALYQKYEGTQRGFDIWARNIREYSMEDMKALAWADSKGNITSEAIGTHLEPGPVRMIHWALHDPDRWLGQLKIQFGDDAVRIHNNAKLIAAHEEVFRKADPNMRLLNEKDYFYRGVVFEVEGYDPKGIMGPTNFSEATERLRSLMVQKPSFMQERAKEFPTQYDLDAAGFRPIKWNPVDQAVFSSRMGMQTRIEAELVNLMLEPSLGLMKVVDSAATSQIAEITSQGWVKVPDDLGLGLRPMKEDGYERITANLAPENQIGKKIETSFYVQQDVLNTLNDMFGSPAVKRFFKWSPRNLSFVQKRKMLQKFTGFSIDDLIYIPKTIKLWLSLFQQRDFWGRKSVTAFASSSEHLVKAILHTPFDSEKALGELIEAHDIWKRLPNEFIDAGLANMSGAKQRDITKILASHAPVAGDPNFTWPKLLGHGANIGGDTTVFGPDDIPRWVDEAIESFETTRPNAFKKLKKLGKSPGNFLQNVQEGMRNGLFDGFYRSTIMKDIENNLIPMVKRNYSHLNPRQQMGIIADISNVKWSVIPASQSMFKGNTRQVLMRTMFSLMEFESLGKQTFRAFSGKNKAFYGKWWAGAVLWWITAANMIHYSTTSLTRIEGDKIKWEFKPLEGEFLPLSRYSPVKLSGRGAFTTMNPRFMEPAVPIATSSGAYATMDLLDQLDYALRLFDTSLLKTPSASFFRNRLGAFPSGMVNLVRGKDYYGRNMVEHGASGRINQLAFDLLSPIVAGDIVTDQVKRRWGDNETANISWYLAPLLPSRWWSDEDATLRDVLPGSPMDERLPSKAKVAQLIAGKLSAPTNTEILNRMTKTTYDGDYPGWPGEKYDTYNDVPDSLKRNIFTDPMNDRDVREIERRGEAGYTERNTYSAYIEKIGEIYEDAGSEAAVKLQPVSEELERLEQGRGRPDDRWDPRDQGLLDAIAIYKDAGKEAETAQDIYKENPKIRDRFAEDGEAPDRDDPDWVEWRYEDLRREYVGEKGDWEGFNDAWDLEVKSWPVAYGPDEAEAMMAQHQALMDDKHANSDKPKELKERSKDLAYIRSAGYWDYFPPPTQAWVDAWAANQKVTTEELLRLIGWTKYRDLKSPKDKAIMRRQSPGITAILDLRKKYQDSLRLNDRKLDRAYWKWYGGKVRRDDNVPYAMMLDDNYKR